MESSEEMVCKNCGEYEEAHEKETKNCPSALRYGKVKFEPVSEKESSTK